MRYHLFIDGASLGNPGRAGIGYILVNDEGDVLYAVAKFLGETTNNVAEYTALIEGLKLAVKVAHGGEVVIYTDSELVYKQIGGEYKVKNSKLKPLFSKAVRLLKKLKAKLKYVPREKNKLADRLAGIGAKKVNLQ